MKCNVERPRARAVSLYAVLVAVGVVAALVALLALVAFNPGPA